MEENRRTDKNEKKAINTKNNNTKSNKQNNRQDNMQNNMKDQENNNNKILYAVIAIAVLLAVIIGLVVMLMNMNNKEKENTLAYTELIQKIDDGIVEEVEMTVGSTSVKVKLKDEEEKKNCIVPSTQAFVELIQEKSLQGNDIKLTQKKQNAILSGMQYLYSLLPTILLVVLFVLVFKMQGLGDKGKVYDAETTKSKINFGDVAGLDEEKTEMLEIVDFLKEPKKFYEMGAKIPRGVLLCGQPRYRKNFNCKSNSRRSKCTIYFNEWF